VKLAAEANGAVYIEGFFNRRDRPPTARQFMQAIMPRIVEEVRLK
jgi:hypothetical protein